MTRWSPWLKPDSEEWNIELIAEKHLAELDLIAATTKEAWERRAQPGEMGEIFKRLAIACRGQPAEANDRKATMALFMRYLCTYPAEILAEAVDVWISTQVFMPAISELKALCDSRMKKLERAWKRAEFLASHSRNAHRKKAEDAKRAAELEADRAKNPVPSLGIPITKLSFRHPSNKDTDTPEEKARIARICDEARAKAAKP